MTFFEILALLIFGHFVADYPLQGDFLARGKNRTDPIPSIPFYHPLTAHAVIHGGFVGIITGNAFLGIAEAMMHWFIDDGKCRGVIDFNTDQTLHIICKIAWATVAALIIQFNSI